MHWSRFKCYGLADVCMAAVKTKFEHYKQRLYNALVVSVLLYGAETWTLT